MRTLGIDPGSVNCGYALWSTREEDGGPSPILLDFGLVPKIGEVDKDLTFTEKFDIRLKLAFDWCREMVIENDLDTMFIETVPQFGGMAQNGQIVAVMTGLKLAFHVCDGTWVSVAPRKWQSRYLPKGTKYSKKEVKKKVVLDHDVTELPYDVYDAIAIGFLGVTTGFLD